MTSTAARPRPGRSIIITTYGGETAHTQHCLGRIRRWKGPDDEVLVVAHDETPTLRQFLELCRALRIVDRLILAPPGHGHVRGVNLGFELAAAELVFNVCVDMRVGATLMSECTEILRSRPNVGLIGWHYDWSREIEGSRWENGRLRYSIRKVDERASGGRLLAQHIENIRAAPWHTGRVLASAGDVRFTCVNGSFFGTHRALWRRLGGFDERLYPIHFADDFLTYAILDQGLDVLNLPRRFRCGAEPEEFLALTDLIWQKRVDPDAGVDRVQWTCREPDARLSERENVYLEMLLRSLGKQSTVSVVGEPPWASRLAEDPRARSFRRAEQAPPSDAILCSATAEHACLAERLLPGGVLVLFGSGDGGATFEAEQRLDSLRIVRHDPPRKGFERDPSSTPEGAV